MSRHLIAAAAVAALLVFAGLAGGATGTLPGGTSISVAVTSPTNGAVLPDAPFTPHATAAVGTGAAVANTTLIYIVDVSNSTSSPTGGSLCPNQNVYDPNANTTLDCELLAVRDLNADAIAKGTVAQIGLIAFAGTGTDTLSTITSAAALDLDGSGTSATLVPPGISNFTPAPGTFTVFPPANNLDWVVQSGFLSVAFATPAGWPARLSGDGFMSFTPHALGAQTNYYAALSALKALLANVTTPSAQVVFLSDGQPNLTVSGQPLANLLTQLPPTFATSSGTTNLTIDTFAVTGSGSTCGSNPPATINGSLEQIAAHYGKHCHPLANPEDATTSVPDVISSALAGFTLTVDGVSHGVTNFSTPSPWNGPITVGYEAASPFSLTPGDHQVCATATGHDGGGTGSVGPDCVTVTIKASPTVGPIGFGNGSDTVAEGTPLGISSTVTGGSVAWSATGGTGTCTFDDPHANPTQITCTDDGTYAVTLTVDDGVNPPVTQTTSLVVTNVAPTVTLDPIAPPLAPVGGTVTAHATFTDPGADTFTCSLDWGDGIITPGTISGNACDGTHAYTLAGTFHVIATVTDDNDGAGADAKDATVKAPPAITLGGDDPSTGYAGRVDEGSPFATGGSVAGATSTSWSSSGGTGTCTFADPASAGSAVTCDDNGLYTLTLTAVDEFGQTSTFTEHLLVDNVAPTVTGTDNTGPNPQASLVPMHWTFTDPGNDTFTCTIDWGDGTSGVGTVSGHACDGSHVYGAGGTFHPIATVTDDDGGAGSGGALAAVDGSPSVLAGDASGNEGAIVFLNGLVNDDHGATAHWSITPGPDVDAGATCSFGNEFSPTTTVSCTDDGHYTLTLTANDGVNPPVSSTSTLTLSNVAPGLTLTSSTAGSLTVTVTGTVTDAGANDTQTCSFNWNDATATTTVPVTGGTCAATHTYAPGPTSRTVTVTATDDDGGATTKSRTFTFSAQALKQAVRDQANALIATRRQDEAKLDDVVKKLDDALKPSNWIDGSHLVDKRGEKVFDDEMDAAKKLEDLLKDHKSQVDDAALQTMIGELLQADRLLALTAIADATTAGGDAKKLADAQKELAKGDAAPNAHDAIDHYKHAWQHAQQSTK